MTRSGLLHYANYGDDRCSRIGCSAPATIHAAVLEDDGVGEGVEFTSACDDHVSEMPAAFDQHPFQGSCNMPGAVFVFTRVEGMPGYCDIPGELDALIEAAAATVGASA